MKRFISRLRVAASLLRSGDAAQIVVKLRRGLWSEHRYIALRRDLAADAPKPPTPVAFVLRPLEEGDRAALFASPSGVDDVEAQSQRQSWLDGGLGGCYVATLKDGSPCYMQWLLSAENNEGIRTFFGETLPQLDGETVLLEGAYTPPRYRRLPVMPAAMSELAARGRERGARWALVFVGEDSTSMRKAAEWAGFRPYLIKIERQRFFLRQVSYAPLPQESAVGPGGQERISPVPAAQ